MIVLDRNQKATFPRWLSGRETACQCRRCEFSLWSGRCLRGGHRQPTPVFAWQIPWAEESGVLQPTGLQSRHDLETNQQQQRQP